MIRIPVAVAGTGFILLGWRIIISNLLYFSDWFFLLVIQTALLAGLVVLLRSRGCRLGILASKLLDVAHPEARRRWQFNLKEAFIQTTAVAAIIGVCRGTISMQTRYSREFSLRLYLCEVGLAGLLALTLFVALWVVFGERKGWLRLATWLVVSAASGLFIVWGCQRLEIWIAMQHARGNSPYSYWQTIWFIGPKAWWLPWICLQTGFLMATLWIFRAKGHRFLESK